MCDEKPTVIGRVVSPGVTALSPFNIHLHPSTHIHTHAPIRIHTHNVAIFSLFLIILVTMLTHLSLIFTPLAPNDPSSRIKNLLQSSSSSHIIPGKCELPTKIEIAILLPFFLLHFSVCYESPLCHC